MDFFMLCEMLQIGCWGQRRQRTFNACQLLCTDEEITCMHFLEIEFKL